MGKRKRHVNMGHPARAMKRRAQEHRFQQPDATEKAAQEINRRMRQAVYEAKEDDGLVSGPLTVAAEHLVAQLQQAHGLDGPEHEAAIVAYLVGCWGEIAHSFPAEPELPGYAQWREQSRQRALTASSGR